MKNTMMKIFGLYSSEIASGGLGPTWSPILTVVLITVTVLLIVLLYTRIMRERDRYLAEKMKATVIDKKSFDIVLAGKVREAKRGANFSLVLIKIIDGEGWKLSLGERQYAAVVAELRDRFSVITTGKVIACLYEENMFAVILDKGTASVDLSEAVKLCIDEGSKPITTITQGKISVKFAAGAAMFGTVKGQTADEFFAQVRHALSIAEMKGENTYQIDSTETVIEDDETVKMFRDVKKAAEQGDFSVYYQAIQNEKGEIVAYEGLLKMVHPEYGALDAERFLPVLASSGYMIKVGDAAFTKMCLNANRFNRNRKDKNPTVFSMNFDSLQMTNQHFAEKLFHEVKKRHLVPQTFVVEVSEFDSLALMECIGKIKAYGFGIAFDGFTMTKADTLDRLQLLSPDWIKLPVSFLKTCETDFFAKELVNVLMKYTEGRDVKIIATEVENEADAKCVKELKISYAQGNFIREETETPQ